LLVEDGGSVLLLKLATALSLLTLNSLSLSLREHLLVLNTKLAAMDIHAIHCLNNQARVISRLKVGKGQASEDAVIEMVVKGVWLRKVHFEHD
jgi:hypothetical protein